MSFSRGVLLFHDGGDGVGVKPESQSKKPVYIAIDLKSYYASVECVERGLNPLTANLLVADETRSDKTICLAVSPSLKAMGVPSRPRLFEAKQAIRLYEAQHHTKVEYIIAKPFDMDASMNIGTIRRRYSNLSIYGEFYLEALKRHISKREIL